MQLYVVVGNRAVRVALAVKIVATQNPTKKERSDHSESKYKGIAPAAF